MPIPTAGKLSQSTGYPFFSRKWDADAEIPDLSGKVAIVTGGNTGIGYATVSQLIQHGCRVYMACRSEQRAQDAIQRLHKEQPDAAPRVSYLPFDLTDLTAIDKAIKIFKEKEQRLDIIIANAAVMGFPYKLVNGVEVQFWNHLGHFALIEPLIPLLEKTAQEPNSHVRVVSVASLGHKFTEKPDFSSLEGVNAKMKSSLLRYGQSKLSNILFTTELQNRLNNSKIRCLAVHPGLVHSELTRGAVESYGIFGTILAKMSGYLAMTVQQGAKTQLFAATSPEVDQEDLKGAYLVPIASLATPSAWAQDSKLAKDLWALSEKLVKELPRN